MSAPSNADDDLTPAERRLWDHLELLRSQPPAAGPELIPRIVRSARWQIAIRDQVLFVGAVAMAISEGFSLLCGPSAGDR